MINIFSIEKKRNRLDDLSIGKRKRQSNFLLTALVDPVELELAEFLVQTSRKK